MSDDVIGRSLTDAPAAVSSLIEEKSRSRPRAGAEWARRYVQGRRLTDLLAILIASSVIPVAGLFWPQAVGSPDRTKLLIAALVAIGWFVALRLGRVPESRRVIAEADEYSRVCIRSFAVFGSLVAFSVAVVHVPGIRWDILATLPLGTALILVSRAAWRRRLRSQRMLGMDLGRAVIVGSSREVESVAHSLAAGARAWTTVGVILTDTGRDAIDGFDNGTLAFAGLDAVVDAAAISGADAVILAGSPHDGGVLIRDLAWRLESTGADLVLASSLEGIGVARLSFQPMDGLSVVHVSPPVFAGGKHHLKRAMDALLAGTALIAFGPVLAGIALLVRLDGPGPVLFRQTRVGRGGRTFTMLKFRSMRPGADEETATLTGSNDGNGMLFKLKQDPRVTRVGAFLRRYSLDELPQLWNVLRGDMSLVGPRPPLTSEVARYDGHAGRRLFIKPGLTGLWQVSGRSDLTWEQSVRLDLFYVANWSLLGDIAIMARTLKVVLRPSGAY